MSYSILIDKKNKEKDYIPFSTHQNYENNWVPIIDELNLNMINQFKYGVSINEDELSELIEELEKSKTLLNDDNKERVTFVIRKLVDIKNDFHNIDEIYLG